MTTTVFRSRSLPAPLADALRQRLATAHRTRPFSPADPREALVRVSAIAQQLGLVTTVYRGSLDLVGVEVDHLWLAAETADDDAAEVARGGDGVAGGGAFVVDQSFPLFNDAFVAVLRRWVAGDADGDELTSAAAAAATTDVDARVLGIIPSGLRYLGTPVWSARR